MQIAFVFRNTTHFMLSQPLFQASRYWDFHLTWCFCRPFEAWFPFSFRYAYGHIWSCPPSEGDDDYIFHCHPQEQKIPKHKRLVEWYKKMLDKAISDGVVEEYKVRMKYVVILPIEDFHCLSISIQHLRLKVPAVRIFHFLLISIQHLLLEVFTTVFQI